MPNKEKRATLIKKIDRAVNGLVPKEQNKAIEAFIPQYLHLLSYEDLREHSIMDWAGLIHSHWKLMYDRPASESRVRVYNPTFAEHGWQSPHTVIEISTNDAPFLVDSARMEISRHRLGIHFIIHVGGMKLERDARNHVSEILPWGTKNDACSSEAPIHIEIDRHTDLAFLAELQNDLERVLVDVNSAVDDWKKMRAQVDNSIKELQENPPELDKSEITESIDFLHWLENNNFTFLGSRDYELVGEKENKALKMIPSSGLGVLRDVSNSLKFRNFSEMTSEAINLMMSSQALIIAKTNTQSTVHRPVYTDYIGVKRFNQQGKLIGERRFIGLFTSSAYSSSVQAIPYLRLKVAKIMEGSLLLDNSHARKALLNILETIPRNDLFQGDVDELQEASMGIFNMQERNRVRLFIRKDIYGRYFSCYVYIPTYRFENQLRTIIQDILEWNLSGKVTEYNTYFSDSVLARLHYVVRVDPQDVVEYNLNDIESQIIKATSSWDDQLNKVLLDYYGEEQGLDFYTRYKKAFPSSYRERNNAEIAVTDIKYIDKLSFSDPLTLNLYRGLDEADNQINFKIYQLHKIPPLSDVMPILENMGMRVVGENPYEVKRANGDSVWINDFHMEFNHEKPLNLNIIKQNFQDAFFKVWYGLLEDDNFNKLVLLAELNWQEVNLLRALARYIRQIGVPYGQEYIAASFATYPNIARMLVDFFNYRFSLDFNEQTVLMVTSLESKLLQSFKEVVSLDEDKIFNLYLSIIKAVLRTNYFQTDNGQVKSYLSLKFDPQHINELPLPKPAYEVFVYSPKFEGVHLRCGKVARGGLRWSDRREDFRTEVLGLMKAQQVKNSLIVPTGAKGGFYVKDLNTCTSREEQQTLGIACYQNFIRGLLDLTDNYVDDDIVHPENTIRYDTEDPYFVVAADKGTATFSDIANEISAEYNFWLQDAFASGGKTGYDHKKMGITARGAWVSVERHFKNLNINIANTDFTVAGVGDMAGDVFGNGMLLSRHIKLVAAFNHQHIFIDPNPNPETSYQERERLFNLPRSSWQDYDTKLLSSGGQIFSRSDKSIKLNKQIKKLLDLEQDHIVPNDLIKAILKANVDLLWNGGIGTYVKATSQTNLEAGDKANDPLRVNADELRVKVVGEGGNLGFTQNARVEFALKGGEIYTDFVDNSAGVDCSDNEVNLKILLDDVVKQKLLTYGQRDKLLSDMTDEVAELVLTDNYRQTQAIELAHLQALKQVDLYGRFIDVLEEKNILRRDLEDLPSINILTERKKVGKGLTKPEIAVLVSYSKIFLQTRLLQSDVPEDPWIQRYLYSAFPKRITKRYNKLLNQHRLRREIITTKLSNDLVDEMGAVFIYRMYHETGATYPDIVRAYAAAREIFFMKPLWQDIQALDYKVSAEVQVKMLVLVSKLVRRVSRWLIRHYHEDLDIEYLIKHYKPVVSKLFQSLPELLQGDRKNYFMRHYEYFIESKVPIDLARQIASCDMMFTAMEVVEASFVDDLNAKDILKSYLEVGQRLHLSWLRYQIRTQKNETHWEGLALAAIFDDIDSIQRKLAVSILQTGSKSTPLEKRYEAWLEQNQLIVNRWEKLVQSMRTSKTISPVMLFVGLRELTDLSRACSHKH